MAIAGLVLGILSLFFGSWIGIILGVLGIIFSASGLSSRRGLAIGGLVCAVIGTGWNVLYVILTLMQIQLF